MMGFRDDRLREIMRVKGWEPGDLYRETKGKITYPQIGRYLKEKGTPGAGNPLCDALALIVVTLEIDADYLLDTDDRYEDMHPLQAVAHMSLDRYLVGRSRAGKPVDEADETQLRYVADHSTQPPVWVADWEAHHERVTVSATAKPTATRLEPQRRVQRQRPLRP